MSVDLPIKQLSVYLSLIELFWFAIHDQMAGNDINTLDHGKSTKDPSQCKDRSGF